MALGGMFRVGGPKTAATQVRMLRGTPAQRATASARFSLMAARRRNDDTPSRANKSALIGAQKVFLREVKALKSGGG